LSDTLTFPYDHETIAWSHFLAQHLGKEYTEAFVRAFYPPLNTLDKAQSDLYTLRWLETAVGEQLDGIGTIVGISRDVPNSIFLPFFGFISQDSGTGFNQSRIRHDGEPYSTSGSMADEEYRYAIITKIGVNNSHGTAEDIMTAVNRILGINDAGVFDVMDATAYLYINDMTIHSNDYHALIINDIIPKAAGVLIYPYLFNKINSFGFSNYPGYFGFGIGILARSIASN
jgi:Protein of unknown function (DUF2612)